ncbi:hypothetical protein FRC01_005189 [Tulasnella sp. 417]|nr:hypothetical protein FRC01_005189 [Tulasnella sp. 417]
MFRLLRSAIRTADQFVASGSSRLKKPLENLIISVERNASAAAHRTGSLSSSVSHHLHTHAYNGARAQPIGSNLSFPTRVALGRPLSPSKLPRAPAIPRSISQVGLGTARNFSSTRHVFQNIVDNVPIHTRALWEAEWDLKQKKAAQRKAIKKENKKKQTERIPDKLKAKETVKSPLSPALSAVDSEDSVSSIGFSTYFAAPASTPLVKGVTTSLTIPLYPPTSRRAPLPTSHPQDSFLPLLELRDLHVTHSQHATRVTSLFIRLDGADVWSKGAICECYGGETTGMVTSLKVVFKGWDKKMVKRAIGDAGKGWCELVEEREAAAEAPVQSRQAFLQTPTTLPAELDVTSSFILPTLDFSSNFASHMSDPPSQHELEEAAWGMSRSISPCTTRPTSPIMMSPTYGSVHSDDDLNDGWSSGGEEYDRLSDISIAATPINRPLGFSVNFLERSHSDYNNGNFQVYEPF